MNPEIEKLLKVLDLSEKKQHEWLINNSLIESKYGRFPWSVVLADLAFRLRDEVINEDVKSSIDCWWCEASYEVYLYVIGEENEKDEIGLDTWFSMRAKPIHWIIAALIAKELSKGKSND